MSKSAPAERRTSPALRYAGLLGCHSLATACGLLVALQVTGAAPGPAALGFDVQMALLFIVFLRGGILIASGLHRWSIGASFLPDLGRLAAGMIAGSALFAAVFRSLPTAVWLLELALTTTLTAILRGAQRLADDYDRARCQPLPLEVAEPLDKVMEHPPHGDAVGGD